MTLARRVVAEGIGTGLLVATVVGSGIMGERLSGGNTAIAGWRPRGHARPKVLTTAGRYQYSWP